MVQPSGGALPGAPGTPPVAPDEQGATAEEAEAKAKAEAEAVAGFLSADADRMLDEEYEKEVQRHHDAACAGLPAPRVVAPALFSAVHANSTDRPVIGGTARYTELWEMARGMPDAPGDGTDGINPGARVVAAGLQSRADLNGRCGTVMGYQDDRWGVLFDGDELSVALKPGNLRLEGAGEGEEAQKGDEAQKAEEAQKAQEAGAGSPP
eukprot:TRINITY_DN4352_c5_g1_i1.p1 TRINITY_DN4352_c5_g1~~TRINITY_DN4352_c5_g1_i1.p1  ORF type:complete len:233 (+),score=70.60 TRINITY_DN4352_c5_g1_i1:75-701(+)